MLIAFSWSRLRLGVVIVYAVRRGEQKRGREDSKFSVSDGVISSLLNLKEPGKCNTFLGTLSKGMLKVHSSKRSTF